ncbi:hypothetical protein [Tenacibaculum sp. 190524A05c]|uniref:hypothetical protein n=1 Tax=Tenacibaculum platacis TaxID=3137852 RepID=UPI0031FB52EB
MKKSTKTSTMLIGITVFLGIIMQIDLYIDFIKATGKTKALYGLKHLLHSILPFAITSFILALIFALFSVFLKEKLKNLIAPVILMIIGYLVLKLPFWLWFS